jgi:iron(III) transport system ATP-binding protein
MSAVELAGLHKSYGDVAVLHDFSLRAEQGELVTLLGPSGCGKTTTLRCIAGLERAELGEIRIGDRLVASAQRRVFVPANRRDIGMVFQSYALWPHMTVFGNVAYPLRVRRRDRGEVRRAVMEILALVGMDGYAQRPVTQLSGGQQQRVALARAMVSRPAVLLFDEPLSNLDAKLRRSMRSQIRDAHDQSGGTSVYVTHDQDEAIALSDRVVVIRAGTIEQVGTPRTIYTEPATRFVADFIGFENLLPAAVTETRGGLTGVKLRSGPVPVGPVPVGAVPVGPGRVWSGPVWAGLGLRPAAGTGVVLAARADDLQIGPLNTGNEVPSGAIPGVVRSRLYAGGRVEYAVDIDGIPVVVRAPESAGDLLDAGQGAWVRFPADHTVLVADTRADRDGQAPDPAAESVPLQGAT